MLHGYQPPFLHHLEGGPAGDICLQRGIYHRRITLLHLHRDVGAVQFADGPGHAPQAIQNAGAYVRPCGADGAVQDGVLGNDVRRAARLHLADGDHRGIRRIGFPGHQGLNRHDEQGGHHYRVHPRDRARRW